MQSLFKSIFHGGKTAVLSPPSEVHAEVPVKAPAELNLAPPKSSSTDGAATAPAPEQSIAPAANEEAVLQDFLLKNFLLDESSAQTATAAPEPARVYAHIADPL